MPLVTGFEGLWGHRQTGQKKEQRHVKGIENLRKQRGIPQKLAVGRGMPQDNREDRNAFCNINDLNSSSDIFIRHGETPFCSFCGLFTFSDFPSSIQRMRDRRGLTEGLSLPVQTAA
jgi:hypothetical protein